MQANKSSNLFNNFYDMDIRLVGSSNINATGNDGDNTLISNSGSNVLDGGAGTDTTSFELFWNPVDASLVSNIASGDGSDTLISIENLIGSIYNDNLKGKYANFYSFFALKKQYVSAVH